MKVYIIKKKLNNNVILVQDIAKNDLILIGKGIGYRAVLNSIFTDMEKVTDSFVLKNKRNSENLKEIVNHSDTNLVALIEEEIAYIQNELNTPLNEDIHVTLIDHLLFAIDRAHKQLEFHNPFDEDLAVVYKEEYRVAWHLIRRINREYHANLVQDEVGIVAIHIHAAIKNEDVSLSRKKTELYQATIETIYAAFQMDPSKKTLAHQRLLLHICFAYERILNHQVIGNEILDVIQEKYSVDYIKLKEALEQLAQKSGIPIPDSEVGYLVLHLNRVKDECLE